MENNNRVNVELKTKVYNRSEADFILDRTFSQFGQQEEVSGRTVEQFFIDYENLYYQIPVEGDINSHRYLIQKSSELVDLEETEPDIQPLLDEITLLRSQSVVDQQTIIDLRTQLAVLGRDESSSEKVMSLRTELAEALNESN